MILDMEQMLVKLYHKERERLGLFSLPYVIATNESEKLKQIAKTANMLGRKRTERLREE
jgi:hypothetical protein